MMPPSRASHWFAWATVLCLTTATLTACSAAAQATCETETAETAQSGGHLLGDAAPPVAYSSTPPTSGWHASGSPRFGVHTVDEGLSESEQVTVLEVGGVVVTWNGLDDSQQQKLAALIEAQPKLLASSPYDALADGEVVFAAWGVLQRCQGVNPEALQAFVDRHAGGGPEH